MPAQPGAEKDPDEASRGKRLESWKEIAGYLNRHVTTIRRWEKHEGLPVHRHRHAKLGSIYAYTRELEAWFEGRREESDEAERLPPSTGVPEEGVKRPAVLPVLFFVTSRVLTGGNQAEDPHAPLLHRRADFDVGPLRGSGRRH